MRYDGVSQLSDIPQLNYQEYEKKETERKTAK